MKFGASIWPFQWDPPYEDGISRIASLGFEAVGLIGWNRQILQEYYTPKKVKELRTFVGDSGLRYPSSFRPRKAWLAPMRRRGTRPSSTSSGR